MEVEREVELVWWPKGSPARMQFLAAVKLPISG
jgi:hypothetical protein